MSAIRFTSFLVFSILLVGAASCGRDTDGGGLPIVSLLELGEGENAGAFIDPEPAYETHVVAYGSSLGEIDQDVLSNYDTIILEARTLSQLEPRYYRNAVLYFNPWAKSAWLDDQRPWAEWQPAPGELGDQVPIVMYPDAYCYRFDDEHVQRFLGWIEDFLLEFPGKVKGVFLDDFAYSKEWWLHICSDCDEFDADVIWGPMDGRPGWRDDPLWNRERINAIEEGALALVKQYCGPEGSLIVNGIARENPGTRRFAENAGHFASESWYSLIEPGADNQRFAVAGDLLQVNSIDENGSWAWEGWHDGRDPETGEIENPHGYYSTIRACSLAVHRNLSVGVAYGVEPLDGGSHYSLFLDPADVPAFDTESMYPPPADDWIWRDMTTWFYYNGYVE